MRALYTSASGLSAQQTKLDVISNNIANINTAGFKAKNAQFEELLRSEFSQPDEFQFPDKGRRTDAGLRIGNGVYAVHLATLFQQGNIQQTGNMLDLAIEGSGFFTVGLPGTGANGEALTAYTRAGKFQVDAAGTIVTDAGYPVLNPDGEPIRIPKELQGRRLSIAPNGVITAEGEKGPVEVGAMNIVLPRNPESTLREVGDNLYVAADKAVYDPQKDSLNNLKDPEDRKRIGAIRQGALEMSNVELPQEMTELIQVQRAYQLNARSIQMTDTMMGLANNLRS
ncbi:flagellar basal-body rod protein FlgF [Effusibacillus lacus]|uniref:Flagellar basal-body rod protein FlgG n=1 Tax=Effusibacillus lacus TaxID=1348429 RepID=A0A292YME0_9BACL|nr:flagellar basal-body rod protein FlgF [Effusibacillus lacus]TCS71792.1 flagellar basal-body rod protein FlgG [Effusibacillus lacus]GAX89640.1 flagellar basal-body rod protein FlgG [Effusibacillus lacus]